MMKYTRTSEDEGLSGGIGVAYSSKTIEKEYREEAGKSSGWVCTSR